MGNYRIYVEKKKEFNTEAIALQSEFNQNIGLNLKSLRLINVYDVFNIDKELLDEARFKVFGEVVTDNVYDSVDLKDKNYFAVEQVPGQFDQRADSAMQCLRLIDPNTEAIVKSSKLLIIDDGVDLLKIKKYFINEVEAREKDMSVLELALDAEVKKTGEIKDFTSLNPAEFKDKMGLAMSELDVAFVQDYFKSENRNPTETEIRMLDTYWSDHCRHTTFETELDIKFEDEIIEKAFNDYLSMRNVLNRNSKPITLMDMATVNARYESFNNNLQDLEKSEENNACSIYMDVDIDGKIEKYLLMFKNETHNHPTEIEPFGGASTCIGGAIRDPLSGRSYVYQAMRITGAADITAPVNETLKGKLPQQIISKKAAAGYSSYGNQIGLPTTYVKEIFHPGYVAKRMEVGAVVGAAPVENVRRESPAPGDVVILLGGRTGRDGIGGATGSSKEHNVKSIEVCSAEVQKGNAPEENKLQRLFRRKDATSLIKKSNDFGAGGVSVAIGELADGIDINLDNVPTKYSGLNETELAISESQERMAVVVEPKDVEKFISIAHEQNLEAVVVATITDKNRLVMYYKGEKVVDISRDFINTNGVRLKNKAVVKKVDIASFPKRSFSGDIKNQFLANLKELNVSMQQGLVEMFDATIGANTVLMPYGGKYQLSESQASVVKVPTIKGNTKKCSIMAYGYNPEISSYSPYHGSMYAVVESIAKVVACGGDYKTIRFTFQEYFEKLNKDEARWGKPVAALLGSVEILKQFKLASIGGKDSMSGSYDKLNVPPTLISFAVTHDSTDNIISTEFKNAGNYIYLIKHNQNADLTPNVEELKENYDFIRNNVLNKSITSAFAITYGGIAEALAKMSYGNMLGFNVQTDLDLFNYEYGSILVESNKKLNYKNAILLGNVTNDEFVINGNEISKKEALDASMSKLEAIYPTVASKMLDLDMSICKDCDVKFKGSLNKKEVKVILPVFPGTNCDYDTAKAFMNAGATTKQLIFKNLTSQDVLDSIKELKQAIDESDILVCSGGFSSGDEPEGSGKFIASVLNNKDIKESIQALLKRRGLVLGICNGFQALVKSGLLPNGNGIVLEDNPTLVKNDINRHISHIATTRVASVKSPWLSSFEVGEIHSVAISHGEGKFVVTEDVAKKLFNNGQVAFQYCDLDGNFGMDPKINPNGSYYAIEGIISEDGLILGKMGHSERKGDNVFKNIYGNKNQDIFLNAVNYFKGENK